MTKSRVLIKEAILLLKDLICIPSFSEEEDRSAELIVLFLQRHGIKSHRKLNNVWAYNKFYKSSKRTILLNSHHDTVMPNSRYTKDPFCPFEEDGKLFGLGSNDAGGCLVALIAAFMYYYNAPNLKYNLCLAATAEEENSGANGLELILPDLRKLEFAIVGEPTLMNLAIAERGLLVLDCVSSGKGESSPENEGNAIYKAIKDIAWFRSYQFPKISEMLGPVKMSVTMISAGFECNRVPKECEFTVDVRVTDSFRNEEVLHIIQSHVDCKVTPRSLKLKSSFIDINHQIVRSGITLGKKTFGSPTTSDQAVIDVPSIKIGPGDSARSHSADEFIYVHEVEEGIDIYIKLLAPLLH